MNRGKRGFGKKEEQDMAGMRSKGRGCRAPGMEKRGGGDECVRAKVEIHQDSGCHANLGLSLALSLSLYLSFW